MSRSVSHCVHSPLQHARRLQHWAACLLQQQGEDRQPIITSRECLPFFPLCRTSTNACSATRPATSCFGSRSALSASRSACLCTHMTTSTRKPCCRKPCCSWGKLAGGAAPPCCHKPGRPMSNVPPPSDQTVGGALGGGARTKFRRPHRCLTPPVIFALDMLAGGGCRCTCTLVG